MRIFPKVSLRHAAVVLAGTGGLVAGMVLAVPGVASAQTVTCGETITTNTTLTANLNCTTDTATDALIIGAPGVTLSLGGHEILGPGDSADTYGVYDNGYSGVTVENGSLSNFLGDVVIEGASGADLTGIVVRHISTTDKALESSTSVYGDYLDGASVNHVTSTDAYYGVELEDSEDSTVSGNAVNYGWYALYDEYGTADTWSGNTIKDAQFYGVDTFETTDDVVEGNTVSGTPDVYGVYDDENQDITVTGNAFTDVLTGVATDDSSSGTLSGNTGTGDDWGIFTTSSTDYTISGNTFGHGKYGIETDYPDSEVLTGNTANDNGEAGIFVYSDGQSGYSATLTSNTGNDNRFGLYSQFATTGSRNHASGNKIVNCFNVTCAKAKGGGRPSAAAPPHHPPTMRAAPARRAWQ